MFEYINIFYYWLYYLFYVLTFCYLFYPLYEKCNIQQKIKKNGKTKIISQPKSILAFIYFILLYMLFKCFTFKIIIFMLLLVIIGSLVMYDNVSSNLNEILHKYNKMKMTILCWKIFHTIFTLIYLITQPIYKIINVYVLNQSSLLKNIACKITNNIDFSSDDAMDNFGKKILKISEEFSSMSDYVVKISNEDKIKSSDSKNKDDNLKSVELSDFKDSTLKTNDLNFSKDMKKKMDLMNSSFDDNYENIDEISITETSN